MAAAVATLAVLEGAAPLVAAVPVALVALVALGELAGPAGLARDTTGAASELTGNGSGATLLRSGMSICTSTGIGRGWVSNSSGKPTTPTSTSSTAPIKRWRARLRISSMLSAGRVAGVGLSPLWRNLKKAM